MFSYTYKPICPVCKAAEQISKCRLDCSISTATDWIKRYDEEGNQITFDPNTTTVSYECDRGHIWYVAMKAHTYQVSAYGKVVELGPDTPITSTESELEAIKERLLRLETMHPTFTPIKSTEDHMTLDKFIECCTSGGFIDYDGWGYYATDTMETDIGVIPSDILAGKVNRDYTHVVWYNN